MASVSLGEGTELGFKSLKAAAPKRAKSDKPSLRHTGSDNENDNGEEVGLRLHMAKKLSAFLDQEIVEDHSNQAGLSSVGCCTSDDGFQLLSTSLRGAAVATYDDLIEAEAAQSRRRNHQARQAASSGSEDDDEHLRRLASAAVSGNDIVDKGAVLTTSGRVVGAGENGVKTSMENMRPSAKGGPEVSDIADSDLSPVKKRKKKKKRTSRDDSVSLSAGGEVGSDDNTPCAGETDGADDCESTELAKAKKKKKKRKRSVARSSDDEVTSNSESKKRKKTRKKSDGDDG